VKFARVHPERVMRCATAPGTVSALPEPSTTKDAPERAGLVLAALILVAGVANLTCRSRTSRCRTSAGTSR
jgi:hypothetical protein